MRALLIAFASVQAVIGVLLFLTAVQYALHSLNHLLDVGEADPGRLGPANLISLALAAALLGWMLREAAR